MKITGKSDLAALQESLKKRQPENWIKVGYGTCGIAAGADTVYTSLVEELKKRNLDIPVFKCGCAGMCYAEPLVEVNIEGAPRVFYGRVSRDMVHRIVEEHVSRRRLLDDYIYDMVMQPG